MQLIGDYYREKILTRNDLHHRELTLPRDKPLQIIQYLFGWQLIGGDEAMDCRSEAEARYLRVFSELGFDEVAVPASDEYLEEQALPVLEHLKSRADEILAEHLETVFDPRIRSKIRRDVYAEISK